MGATRQKNSLLFMQDLLFYLKRRKMLQHGAYGVLLQEVSDGQNV